ncbi:hypothetical protein [Clostridium aminobutyricum]|uniref:Uncharacterized protein n=1 Tax=Clostridium aminobutyricum TaxID=33953 RepID=A0A939DAQ0_CLOAM|nr:hypothetical protein [Clostridium aminobutyricum]MBN7774255.1 hypothetical protein [Clostridium aminobutyricum]
MSKHSCLPRSNVLSRVCGTSIDVDAVDFAPSARHLVYMDKVYSRAEATACPLVFALNTSPFSFQTQLLTSPLNMANENLCEEIFGPTGGVKLPFSNCKKHCGGAVESANTGCNGNIDPCRPSCNPCGAVAGIIGNPCEIDENAVFNIVNSYVLINNFNTRPLCSLNRTQVTLDGMPVDSLDCQGGNYTATIGNIVPEITKEVCVDRGLPTRAFFLITNAGPWAFDAKFVLEGTVNTNGRLCCFRAIFETNAPIDIHPQPGAAGCGCACDCVAPDTSDLCPPPVWNSGTVNFAVPDISIPCTTSGISPTINFSFSGKMSLLNPSITVQENFGRLNLVLNTRVVAEPSIFLEVVKKTLFCTTACEGLLPCDGTEAAWIASNQDDDVDSEFECSCGTRREEVESIEDSYCGNTIVFGTNATCNSTCRGF